MDVLSAIILGLVQGIMEFLPVSSSGHLILVREALSVDDVNQLAMDGILHLSTTLAIMVYFWGDIWVLIQTFMRKLGKLPVNEKDLTLLYALLVGTIPAVLLGLLLEPLFDKYLNHALVVVSVLFVSAIFFMYAEWRYYLNPPQDTITVRRGWQVGLFQALALLPGFSRSGATLAGGMLLGLTRYEAARFSFLLAIPITLGFGTKKLLDLLVIEGEVNWLPIMLGASISFVTALIVIHFFLAFIRRYTLWPFIWYSIVLSLTIFYFTLFV
ncbi:MAG: undecaprenyl-diphosphatase UppP [Candidatus Nomurabacteria bacterium]|nr:undecaprenyl-diphosphatase UppP [Candidatus Nomurabacteria bacterium]USN88055.1 MAG: undecaprenyl-diphosphatase UppP [Candidatus Nomurabacteria bacterium]